MYITDYIQCQTLGPGQTTRFFTRFFPQHLISMLSVVEHVWLNDSIFRSTFSRLFNYSYFRNVYQLKIFTIIYICGRMRRCCACFHSTSSTRWPNGSIFTQQQFFCSNFFTKIKLHSTSFDFTRLTQQGGQKARICARFFGE